MRAMVLTQFGGPENLSLRDLPDPKPQPGEVLVRVVAAAVNPVDAKLRAAGQWAGLTPPVVLGYDAAGIVEQIGVGVSEFQPGDEVFYTPQIVGNPHGTYATLNAVPAAIVAKKPANLSFIEAAAIPLAGGTAWEALVRRLAPKPGETILIHGAAGGVGSFALQFAKAAGTRVLATASSGNLSFLRELGADVAIDYRSQDVVKVALAETFGRGVDAAFDIEGDGRVGRSLPAIRPFGRIACVLPPEGDLSSLSVRNLTLHGVFLTRERARLEEMRPLFERRQVKVVVDRVLPLAQLAEAHRRIDSHHGRGKIVLAIDERRA